MKTVNRMEAISSRIKRVCSGLNNQGHGVMNPAVCPYCFGCPIATIVVGVAGNNNIQTALPIPRGAEGEKQVSDWLDGLEKKYSLK